MIKERFCSVRKGPDDTIMLPAAKEGSGLAVGLDRIWASSIDLSAYALARKGIKSGRIQLYKLLTDRTT